MSQLEIAEMDLGRVRPALALASFANETDYRARRASLKSKYPPSNAATCRREMLYECITPG